MVAVGDLSGLECTVHHSVLLHHIQLSSQQIMNQPERGERPRLPPCTNAGCTVAGTQLTPTPIYLQPRHPLLLISSCCCNPKPCSPPRRAWLHRRLGTLPPPAAAAAAAACRHAALSPSSSGHHHPHSPPPAAAAAAGLDCTLGTAVCPADRQQETHSYDNMTKPRSTALLLSTAAAGPWYCQRQHVSGFDNGEDCGRKPRAAQNSTRSLLIDLQVYRPRQVIREMMQCRPQPAQHGTTAGSGAPPGSSRGICCASLRAGFSRPALSPCGTAAAPA